MYAVLDYIGSKFDRNVHAYLIGGAALMLHGLKDDTRDIDLCADYQDTNYLVSWLRLAGKTETYLTGFDGFQFLRITFEHTPVGPIACEIFCNEEFRIIDDARCQTYTFGQMSLDLPDAKTIVALKDLQIQGLLKEHYKLAKALEEIDHKSPE